LHEEEAIFYGADCAVLKQAELEVPVAEVIRKVGRADLTIFSSRVSYSGFAKLPRKRHFRRYIISYFNDNKVDGGRGGIRTPDTLSGTPVFKTGAINHSATLPV
jgi:hypothetical protein